MVADFEEEGLPEGFAAAVEDFFFDVDVEEAAFLLEDAEDFREEDCASNCADDDAARPSMEPSKTET